MSFKTRDLLQKKGLLEAMMQEEMKEEGKQWDDIKW